MKYFFFLAFFSIILSVTNFEKHNNDIDPVRHVNIFFENGRYVS